MVGAPRRSIIVPLVAAHGSLSVARLQLLVVGSDGRLRAVALELEQGAQSDEEPFWDRVRDDPVVRRVEDSDE